MNYLEYKNTQWLAAEKKAEKEARAISENEIKLIERTLIDFAIIIVSVLAAIIMVKVRGVNQVRDDAFSAV